MFKKEDIFSKMISVLESLNVTNHTYIDDISGQNQEYKYASILGAYSRETLETLIGCLFKEGVEKFKPLASEYIEKEGISKFKEEFFSFTGFMQGMIEYIKPVFSEKIINKSTVVELYENNEVDLIESTVKAGLSQYEMLDIVKDKISESIQKFRDSFDEFVINDLSKKSSEIEFKVDEEFFAKYGEKIFIDFIENGILLDHPKFSQFLDFCNGRYGVKKLKFDRNTSLMTFYKELKKKGKISISKKFIKFFSSTCTNSAGSLTYESLGSNKMKNTNHVVEDILKKYLP